MSEAGISQEVEICGLCNPSDGKVRYIGKSVNSIKRFADHLKETRRDSPLYRWIKALRNEGAKPNLIILTKCPISQWQTKEKELISEYRKLGPLLNVADGGNAPFCSKEVRAKNGRTSAIKRISTPEKRKIWQLKLMIGQALKRGYVNPETKELLRLAANKRPELFGEWANL